ncbi:hypothetical protein CH299_18600 [Rhodococcus sp. 14-2686-1-2]|nr:hypothetical protein CH301_17905 [Rhodococcus sp. 15-1189-1-1a]OZF12133.1 hypothetical protein CH299_18600 [Rhodococcus sp. 14-2686-1-2]
MRGGRGVLGRVDVRPVGIADAVLDARRSRVAAHRAALVRIGGVLGVGADRGELGFEVELTVDVVGVRGV